MKGYGRKGLGNTKIYVDKDGHYAGWGGDGLREEEIAFVKNEQARESEKGNVAAALVFLGVLTGLVALIALFILR